MRVGIVADAVVDLGERANRGEILRRGAQDLFELVTRFVEPADSSSDRPSVTRAEM